MGVREIEIFTSRFPAPTQQHNSPIACSKVHIVPIGKFPPPSPILVDPPLFIPHHHSTIISLRERELPLGGGGSGWMGEFYCRHAYTALCVYGGELESRRREEGGWLGVLKGRKGGERGEQIPK